MKSFNLFLFLFINQFMQGNAWVVVVNHSPVSTPNSAAAVAVTARSKMRHSRLLLTPEKNYITNSHHSSPSFTQLHVQLSAYDAEEFVSAMETTKTTTSDSSEQDAAALMLYGPEPAPAWAQAMFLNQDSEKTIQTLINAALLTVSFGYAAYTIFNIDHGMTRGWSQSEIAMRIPLDTWSSYESSLEEKPVFTKTLINVIIYLLGDWLSQTVFQKKNILDFDAMRTLRNGFIGLCFGPLVHEYYQFSDTILPVEGGIVNRLEKIVMDQTIYLTVKCSIYIAAVGLLRGDSWEDVKTSVKDRIAGIVFTAWKFWPLVHCITYSVIPARHRILWVNCVDLVWNAILATMSQKKIEVPEEQEAAANAVVAAEQTAIVGQEQQPVAVLAATSATTPSTLDQTVLESRGDPFVLTQELIPTESEGLFANSTDIQVLPPPPSGNSTSTAGLACAH